MAMTPPDISHNKYPRTATAAAVSQSQNNGVIRIGRKGRKKFAFGEDGEPFDIDVVEVFHQWVAIDDDFRTTVGAEDRSIPASAYNEYDRTIQLFVSAIAKTEITIAEAKDFVARVREQYDELADFFQPKSREERESPDTSGVVLQFSVEEDSTEKVAQS